MSLAAVATRKEGQPSFAFYQPQGAECELFGAAFRRRLPVLLKRPTGCGKTRLVAHMAAKLGLALDTMADGMPDPGGAQAQGAPTGFAIVPKPEKLSAALPSIYRNILN